MSKQGEPTRGFNSGLLLNNSLGKKKETNKWVSSLVSFQLSPKNKQTSGYPAPTTRTHTHTHTDADFTWEGRPSRRFHGSAKFGNNMFFLGWLDLKRTPSPERKTQGAYSTGQLGYFYCFYFLGCPLSDPLLQACVLVGQKLGHPTTLHQPKDAQAAGILASESPKASSPDRRLQLPVSGHVDKGSGGPEGRNFNKPYGCAFFFELVPLLGLVQRKLLI